MTRAVISVRGFVQGVGYRRFAEKRAATLNLSGWVRNMDDGAVQCCVEGDRTVIEQFIEQLKKGPSFSKVSQVTVAWEPFTGEFKDFRITF